jgi:Tol biopolymer transport system component
VLAAPDADLVFGVGTGDGRALALWSPRAGGIPTKLRLPVLAFDPAPSPDGRLIAFAGAPVGAGVGANVDVYVVHRDGSNLRRLTTDRGSTAPPRGRPTGAGSRS